MLLYGLTKDIWVEGLDNDDPENNGAAFDEDEDGFIKVMDQYILHLYSRAGAKIL